MGGSVNSTGTASGMVSSVSRPLLLFLLFDSGETEKTKKGKKERKKIKKRKEVEGYFMK